MRRVVFAVLLLSACADDPAAVPGSSIPDESVPAGSTAPVHAEPLVTAVPAAPDGGLDTVTVTSNAPIRQGSIDPQNDITLEDVNSSAVFTRPAEVVYHGTDGLTVDFLYNAGTLVGGHVFQLTLSAAHVSDYFGGKLKADFVGTFKVPLVSPPAKE